MKSDLLANTLDNRRNCRHNHNLGVIICEALQDSRKMAGRHRVASALALLSRLQQATQTERVGIMQDEDTSGLGRIAFGQSRAATALCP